MNFREASKLNWSNSDPDSPHSLDQINVGSLQRIADACELMAKTYQKLTRELTSQRKSLAKVEKKGEVVL